MRSRASGPGCAPCSSARLALYPHSARHMVTSQERTGHLAQVRAEREGEEVRVRDGSRLGRGFRRRMLGSRSFLVQVFTPGRPQSRNKLCVYTQPTRQSPAHPVSSSHGAGAGSGAGMESWSASACLMPIKTQESPAPNPGLRSKDHGPPMRGPSP